MTSPKSVLDRLDEIARRAVAHAYPELDRLELLALIDCVRAADAWFEAHRINYSGAMANEWDAIADYASARKKLEQG